ncbi:hypothetical protein [Desulfolucanica intricata]|uniref:hypothetical protein n=1 Tax=Desulfolucanica intricata TaxID=1285191 RepID=UPI000830E686|nr:hypothetical protein [Desulfolucanica intricata]
MSRRKILFIFILIHIPLAFGIYAGTFLLPNYMDARQAHLKQTNYFLTNNKTLITDSRELILAESCKAFLANLENEYKSSLETLAQDAYQEYTARKAKDPDFSAYDLAAKYLTKLNKLDKHSETKLNNYLNNMEQELRDNNLSTELIKQAQYAYTIKMRQIKNDFYRSHIRSHLRKE